MCITAGSTLDEAKDMAREALPFHVEGLLADGEQLPDPMSLEQALDVDPMGRNAVAFLVDVPFEDPIVRANITVPKGILDRIDRYAKAQGLSRSAFLTPSYATRYAANAVVRMTVSGHPSFLRRPKSIPDCGECKGTRMRVPLLSQGG